MTINNCWNQIGVWGKQDCPELEKVVHCRNCPVYGAAASQLLDVEPPPNYLREWTDHFAAEKRTTLLNTHSVLIFRIGAEWFALPTAVFQEVSERRPVHSLPHRRNSIVRGLVNIRGELVVCVSLGEALGLEEATAASATRQSTTYERLLVVTRDGSRLVFPVSEVRGICRHHPADLRALPATVSQASATYTRGILSWNGKSVGCLDDERVFSALNRSLS
jgi:chemotaxis-related protein WspD